VATSSAYGEVKIWRLDALPTARIQLVATLTLPDRRPCCVLRWSRIQASLERSEKKK
jgi:hypothetical protein